MKNKLILLTVILWALIGFGGCTSAPIQNVGATPIKMNMANYELEDIEKAILLAGTKESWQMRVERPGLIRATKTERTHMAEVMISFTDKQYSISYLDSKNLGYKGGKIHKAFNAWVSRLNDKIQLEFSIPR